MIIIIVKDGVTTRAFETDNAQIDSSGSEIIYRTLDGSVGRATIITGQAFILLESGEVAPFGSQIGGGK